MQNILAFKQNENVARNVILFLGDGMGVSTVTGGRIYSGQLQGQTGEEYELTFDKFPYVALSKVMRSQGSRDPMKCHNYGYFLPVVGSTAIDAATDGGERLLLGEYTLKTYIKRFTPTIFSNVATKYGNTFFFATSIGDSRRCFEKSTPVVLTNLIQN